jgi:hypothetical protein
MDARVSQRTKRQRAALGGGSGLRAGFGYRLRLGCFVGRMVVVMSTQPEALRLAKELVLVHQGHADEGPSTFSEAAAKLRRLHSVNAELLDALKLARLVVNPANAYGIAIEAAIAKATGETK